MTKSKPIRIIIADDHTVVRDGLAAILGMQCDMQIVAQASDGSFPQAITTPFVPSENVRELFALLRQAGADVTVCFENAGHDLTDMTFETTRRWLAEKPDEPHP